jgi:hypothetical protein
MFCNQAFFSEETAYCREDGRWTLTSDPAFAVGTICSNVPDALSLAVPPFDNVMALKIGRPSLRCRPHASSRMSPLRYGMTRTAGRRARP